LNSREIAKRLGVTHTAVNKAAKSGRIPREADGSFKLSKVKAAWDKNANQHQRGRGLSKRKKEKAEPSPEFNSEGATFFEAQRQREWLRVEKDRLELELRKGKLLERDKVAEQWAALVSAARNRMLLVSGKAAPLVAGLSDARECQAVIDQEIREALALLAG